MRRLISGHLDCEHHDEYITKVNEMGWVNKLPSHAVALRSQQSSISLTGGGPGLVHPDEFSITKMHHVLVNLIMANDQVCHTQSSSLYYL